MKRSELNAIMRDAVAFIKDMKFQLPPFAFWSPADWATKGHDYDEIRDNMLGWDITDFGSGDYKKIGLLMFTLRNGNFNDKVKYVKPYAEKLLIVEEGQITPYHFHWSKMEDIINRGGGDLLVQVYNSDEKEDFATSDVPLAIDGHRYSVKAGSVVRIKPGESISIQSGMYHKFWAEGGRTLLGEVSKVNDDRVDNRFHDSVGRFPAIEEDEAPLYLLGNEYPAAEWRQCERFCSRDMKWFSPKKSIVFAALLAVCSAFAASPRVSVIGDCTRDVPRVEPLDGKLWESSEWISVATALVVNEEEKKRHRAADGTSVFWHRHMNAKKVKSAKWMATGLGVFDLYVNGGLPLGWDFLKPGFTDFAKTKRSFTYDITSCLRTGVGEANDFGAEVSAGWWRDKVNDYAGRKSAFRGVIVFTYADGSTEVFGTKASEWQGCIAGPVLHAGIYDGEEFDARASNMARKPSGRFEPGGCERSEEFRGEILPSEGAEIVLREDLTEKRNMVGSNLVVKPGKAVVVDFGQNCSAVPFFEFRAKRGTVLTALPGEMLNDADKGVHGCDGPKGSVYRANLRIPNDGMRVVYTFAGEGWEKYLPRFTYFGYRYVSITATDDVEIRCVESLPVTSIAKAMETGRIETGVADLNQFFTNVYWTQLSNFLSVPTDCPQRNERLGWGADAQIYSEAGSYIADTSRFFRKWTRDVRDGRCEDGGYPSAAPRGPWGRETFNFGWADAGVMVPWTVWKMFGDRTILEENYEAMAKFVRKIDETKYDFEDKIDYLWADWLSFETFESCGNAYGNFYGKWKHHPDAKNYRLYLAACHWLNDARLLVRMAEACGRADDAAGFRESAGRALAYIRDRFLEPDGLLLKPMRHLQTACVFALKFGIVEGPAKTATLALLTKSIRDHGNVMLTGILGTRYLLDALAECGETELCYTLLLQRGNPSWLHSVGHGATTVWERCNGYTKERGFGPVSMNSYNHYAFGAVIAWVYRTAAGIAADPEKPGFRNIIMAPKPDRRLGYVKAEYRSRAGLVKSAWRYEGSRWIWDFTVPAGATATVILPGESEAKAYSAGSYHIDVPSGTAAVGTTPKCKTAK